jgi:hypothetical protein
MAVGRSSLWSSFAVPRRHATDGNDTASNQHETHDFFTLTAPFQARGSGDVRRYYPSGREPR